MQNINSQVMKNHNALMILKTVRRSAPISRTKLVEMVGLTSASVINITNDMLRTGLLVQTGLNDAPGQGRKSIMLDVNPDAAYVVALYLSTEHIVTAVADLRSGLHGVSEQPIECCAPASVLLDAMCACIECSIAASGVAREKILGIALSLPGPLNTAKGIIINPPNFPRLAEVPIRDILEERFDWPVCCDRESNNAVLAEYLLGSAVGYKTAFFLSLFRTGVGGGIIAGGNVLHGYCDSAGEIGHTLVDSDGARCSCGNFGCLEAQVSEQSILRQVQRLSQMNYALNSSAYDARTLTLKDVFRLSSEGDPVCKHVVRKTASYISIALGNAISLYSPELIVLGGSLPAMSPELVDLIRRQIAERPYPRHCRSIQVVTSHFGEMVFVTGAAEQARNRFIGSLLH